MPIVIAPNGQAVFCLTQDIVHDRLREGCRLPGPSGEPTPTPAPAPDQAQPEAGGPLDLMTATLSQLRDLPDVGTARAREIRALAKAGKLSLDSLQEDIPEVNWVALYDQGMVVWPGGLHLTKAEQETE